MSPLCSSCQLLGTDTGESQGPWPGGWGWTLRMGLEAGVTGQDGAALPGAWSELLTAATIGRHLRVCVPPES